MSKMNPDLVWYPPQFPGKGRLPNNASQVAQNYKQQDSLERAWRDELCQAAGLRIAPPCCKTLHISLFFDGTGNNLNNDLYEATRSDPPGTPHPTNIARLFRATIGQGYAGGVQGYGNELLDLPGTAGDKYFKYYIPGVGTPFPEVLDLDYSTIGLAAAAFGEERINWALLRIIDALRRTLGMAALSDNESWRSVKAMTSQTGSPMLVGARRRMTEFQRLLRELVPQLKPALTQPEPGKPKLLGIKLYVYGFSRGAASARTFINWLVEQLPGAFRTNARPELCLTLEDADWKLPLSVEFLGLLDTVASVGVTHIAPLAEGHMGWADGTMELPDNGLIKDCVHLVSAHEQRLCFPVDSVCRQDGTYPSYAREVVYPGMHSDIGGGYPPGDQGKATADNDGYLLSQIALHDMYAAAFNAGAPLKVPEMVLPSELIQDKWRSMPFELGDQFDVDTSLVNRFNAWRELTLNLPSSQEEINNEEAAEYLPSRAPINVVKALEDQIGWITAWRIGRYAHGTYKTQRFYKDAAANGMDKDSDPKVRADSERKRNIKQKRVEEARRKMRISAKKNAYILYPPGPKDFDPALGQTQLREAAKEFHEDYYQKSRTSNGNVWSDVVDVFSSLIYIFRDDDLFNEYKKIREMGNSRFDRLFPLSDEINNAHQPEGLLRALFDDQIHDSRAWFLYATFEEREPYGSYFLYRMIYFGEIMSKNITPLVKYGRFVEEINKFTILGSNITIERLPGGNKIIITSHSSLTKENKSVVDEEVDIPIKIFSDAPVQLALTDNLNISQQKSAEVQDLSAIRQEILKMWS
ncbi:hypothetical protein C7M52_00654 [Mixta theicola]|nr:DUF2235 domain-containing protein [Mixta theicola]QHM74712.1 hypothetical protein C7M52_00654 [Mixta theicola]